MNDLDTDVKIIANFIRKLLKEMIEREYKNSPSEPLLVDIKSEEFIGNMIQTFYSWLGNTEDHIKYYASELYKDILKETTDEQK